MNNEEQIKALQEEVDSLKATLAEIKAMPVDEDLDDDYDDVEEDIDADGEEEDDN